MSYGIPLQAKLPSTVKDPRMCSKRVKGTPPELLKTMQLATAINQSSVFPENPQGWR
jgi:hypothetical protein